MPSSSCLNFAQEVSGRVGLKLSHKKVDFVIAVLVLQIFLPLLDMNLVVNLIK